MTDDNRSMDPGKGQGSSHTQGSGLEPNVASCLSYVCGALTGLIFLLIEKENKEVRFHAWQSIFINVACVAYAFVTAIFSMIPFVAILMAFLNFAVGLGILAVVIAAAVKAYQGGRLNIPVISDLANKQVG